jgi:hypothetical protein
MATRLRITPAYTVAEIGASFSGPYRDLNRATAGNTAFTSDGALTSLEPAGERKFKFATFIAPMEFWSERVATAFTLSGELTCKVYVNNPTAGTTLRFRFYKVTAGGSRVETLIATGTSASFSTGGQQTLTATPSTPIDIVRGERFKLLLTLPTGGNDITSIAASNTDSVGTYIDLAEDITMLDNVLKLWLRRTSDSGIGNFFDMLDTIGSSAATTGVRATSAGATELQWTRTSGGTALEWVTGRVREPFSIGSSIDYFSTSIWANESANAANCIFRVKVFHRAPDGTETLIYTMTRSTELSTSPVAQTTSLGAFTATLHQAMPFREDDRMVLRCYVTNNGTMGGGATCTLTYDLNAITGTGASYLGVNGAFTFKAEGDPAASHEIAGSLATTGMGT